MRKLAFFKIKKRRPYLKKTQQFLITQKAIVPPSPKVEDQSFSKTENHSISKVEDQPIYKEAEEPVLTNTEVHAEKANKSEYLLEKSCKNCGSSFTAANPKQEYCSPVCKTAFYRRNKKIRSNY